MRSVIFDLYNTLIDIKTDEHCEKAWLGVIDMLAKRGVKTTPQKLAFEYDRYYKLFTERAKAERRFLYPEVDWVSGFESIARAVGGFFTREQALAALKTMRRDSIEHLRLFDGTLELLDELKKSGVKLYVLSNAQSAFTVEEMGSVGLLTKLDGAMLSSDRGCKKPDPEFFAMLFDEYGIDKRAAVMVGDDMHDDISGAERFGIAGIWAKGGAAAHAREIIEFTQRL